MYPQHPAGPPGQLNPPEPPRSIRSAVRLMYAGAIVSAVGVILLDVLLVVARASMVRTLSGSSTNAQVHVGTFVAAITVLGAIEVGLWLWMAWAVKRGLGWARIVSTVIFGINVLFTLLSLGRGGIPGIVILAIGAGAAWQLWRPDATAFFSSRTR